MYLLKIKSICLSKDENERKTFVEACIAHAKASKEDEGNLFFNCVCYPNKHSVKVNFEELWESKEHCVKHLESAKARPHIEVINRYRSYKETLKELEIEEE